jgi:hypothetical protein
MSSAALPAQGTLIKIGDGASPEVFTSLGEVSSIDGPGGQAAVIDVTDLSSTAKEKRMGLQDEGQLSFEINFLPADAQHAQLRTDKASGDSRNFQLLFTDSPPTTWTFAAFVLGVPVSFSVDNVTKGSVTLEITGSITET